MARGYIGVALRDVDPDLQRSLRLTVSRAGKRLELLREVLPGLHRLAIIGNVDYPAAVQEIAEVRPAARTLGLGLDVLEIRRAEDIAGTFPALKSGSQALLCVPTRS